MVEYKNYRTGLTFKEIRQILKNEAKNKYAKGQYMFITRHTVLGRWHQIKKDMYYEEMNYINQSHTN